MINIESIPFHLGRLYGAPLQIEEVVGTAAAADGGYLTKEDIPTGVLYSGFKVFDADAGATGTNFQYVAGTWIPLATVSDITFHTSRVDNPHNVTASQVGLGSVNNTADSDKPVSVAQALAIGVVQTDFDTHEARVDNPHLVTKAQVGLGLVDNTADVNKPVSTAQAIAIAVVQTNLNSHEIRVDNPHAVTLQQVLAQNPVSTLNATLNNLTLDGTLTLTGYNSTNWNSAYAFTSAFSIADYYSTLNSKYEVLANKGVANGYVPLDAGAKILELYLPDSILGQVSYQGVYNATTNTPTLSVTPASTTKGEYYIVNVAGTFDGVGYVEGDWIISNGTSWNKVDNSDAVTTVFGRLGNILAIEADYQAFYPRLSQTYANPSWISSIARSKVTYEGTSGQFVKGDGSLDSSVYITAAALPTDFYSQAQIQNFFSGTTAITGYNKANWDAAYDWGNHASAGYVLLSGVYYNPNFIAELHASKLSGFFNSITSTGTITATGGNSTNWNSAYENRIATFSTTGNAGAATFAANVLNIPNYTLAGLGYIGALNANYITDNNQIANGANYITAASLPTDFVSAASGGTFGGAVTAPTFRASTDSGFYISGIQTIYKGSGYIILNSVTGVAKAYFGDGITFYDSTSHSWRGENGSGSLMTLTASSLTVNAGDFVLIGSNAASRLTIAKNYSSGAVGVSILNTSGVSVVDINGNTGSITATSFSGNGAGLTNVNASNVSSGTLADARLSSNVALKNIDNNFSVLQTFSDGSASPLTITRTSQVGIFFNDTTNPRYLGVASGDLYFGTDLSHGLNNLVYHSGNFGKTQIDALGIDATTLGGLSVHAGTNNEANKIVRTDSNGYLQTGWINTISGDNGTAAFARIYASSDSYLRYYTPANFITVLNSFGGINAATLNGFSDYARLSVTNNFSASQTITGNTSSVADATLLTLKGTGENIGNLNFDNTFGTMVQLKGTKEGAGGAADEGLFSIDIATNAVLANVFNVNRFGINWVGSATSSGNITALSYDTSSGSSANHYMMGTWGSMRYVTNQVQLGGFWAGQWTSVGLFSDGTLRATISSAGLDVVNSVQSSGQGRFSGWYTSGTGTALEIGFSGVSGQVISFNRDTSAYQPLAISASTITFTANTGATALTIGTDLNAVFTGAVTAASYNVAGASLSANTTSSFTPWQISGTKGGYGGILDASSLVATMFDGAGNGGFYREAGGGWYLYWSQANVCLGIGDSTTNASYSIYAAKGAYLGGSTLVEGTADFNAPSGTPNIRISGWDIVDWVFGQLQIGGITAGQWTEVAIRASGNEILSLTDSSITSHRALNVTGDITLNGTSPLSKIIFSRDYSASQVGAQFLNSAGTSVVDINANVGRVTALEFYGNGSGLTNVDAATLGGNAASAFYLATNPSGYTANVGTVTSVAAGSNLTGGTITGSGTIALANTVSITGTITASNFIDTSDRRLKSNITKLTNGLDTLKKVNWVSYEKGGFLEYGVIAQEVRSIRELSHIVKGDESKEMLGVSYSNFHAINALAILEVDKKIETQQEKIIRLEKRITELEKQL